jgi:hypothetical protein
MHRLPAAIVFALLAQLACAQDAPSTDQAVAGTVSLIEGDVRVLDRVLKGRRPAVGDPVYEGESIVTGADGEVHLDMQDGGYIGVRPGTKMQILEFKAEGGDDDGFLLGLLQGSFRAVTGWITKGNRKAEVTTATATIGIRGTDYEPLVIPEGSTAGEPGTYNRVNIGETELRTAQGSVIVRPNQAAFVPHGGAIAPRVLARMPALFKATRNEKVFQGLHQRIHRNLNELRQKRIKQIQLRRKEGPKAGQAPKAAAQKTEAVQKSGAKAGAAKADAEKKPAADTRLEQRKREQLQREEALKQKRLQEAQKEQIKRDRLQDAQKERLKRDRLQGDETLKQKRLQEIQKEQRQREAQKAPQAQKQTEERKRKLQELEHAKAAKKAAKEEQLKRRLEKHD